MADVSQDLGQRIVQAARLAVAMHLARAASGVESTGRVEIGGAGPRVLTDEQTPPPPVTGERPRRSRPSPLPRLSPLADWPEAA